MNGRTGAEGLELEAAPGRAQAFGRAGLALLLALLAAAAVGFAAFRLQGNIATWLLAGGGALAAFGLFSIFAWIAGLFGAGRTPPQDVPLDQLMDAAGEALVVTDEKGRRAYANAGFYKLVSKAGSGRASTFEFLYSGYPDIADAIYRLAQAAREGRAGSEEIRLAAGSSAAGAQPDKPTLVRLSVTPMPQNGKTYALWRYADISQERHKQEQAFQHLQHIISSLDNAPAGFFCADHRGRITYLNATLAQWLGHDLAVSADGLTLEDIAPGRDGSVLKSVSMKPGQSRTDVFDIDLRTRSGEALPARIIQRLDTDTQGVQQPSRVMVIAKSKTGSASIAEDSNSSRLARFMNTVPIGIAEIDQSSIIINANPAFVALSPHAKRGDSLGAMVVEGQRPRLAQTLLAAGRSTEDIHTVDVTLVAEPPRLVQFVISRVPAQENGFVVYAVDTTENKALEVQLGQAQKMQAIGQLAGGVAHDFNNVLTAIIGFSDLLLTRHKPTDPAFADIMNIKQNANRAANLVRQLLAFSRRQTLRPEVMNLTDVLSDLGNLLRRLLGEKIDLKILHGRDLGLVRIDLNQFEQTIINLAVNARDAMPKGGTLTIRTANIPEAESGNISPLMPAGDYLLCEVEDTGQGIPAEIRDKIWEPFFSTKEVGKGTGLGLSTVYGFVKQTGGFIFCDSEVERGTVFRMYLPRHKPEAQVAEAEVKEEKKETKRADLTGKGTILLVEDEDAVRSFASRALKSRGYSVLEADSGERALEVIETGQKIDLILSDVVMPSMDGPTLLRELRKRGNMTKVIFISGYAEDAFQKNLEGQTDFAFLPKPFTLKQLAETVKDVMES
jgi:two-component system cell cycle sensor histidine kinase/response regulator CckA